MVNVNMLNLRFTPEMCVCVGGGGGEKDTDRSREGQQPNPTWLSHPLFQGHWIPRLVQVMTVDVLQCNSVMVILRAQCTHLQLHRSTDHRHTLNIPCPPFCKRRPNSWWRRNTQIMCNQSRIIKLWLLSMEEERFESLNHWTSAHD